VRITVVHVGPPGTVVGGFLRAGISDTVSSVFNPGEAASLCRNAADSALVGCVSPGPACRALWRVDQPH
jgi:hypothetical protein